jgi:heme/copper-type cytochrome/quinol oxidase subunit 3
MLIKVFILAVLVLILASLFSALAMLFRQRGQNERMVKALTVRISLSIGLFLLLLAGSYFGIIPHHGLK